MKKFVTALIMFSGIFFILSGCGKSSVNKNNYVKTGKYKLYPTKILKVKPINEDTWIVTGTTKAPNGTKIAAIFDNTNNKKYNNNRSDDGSVGDFSKVRHGKFKAHVEVPTTIDNKLPINLHSGKHIKINIFAIKNFSNEDSLYTLPSKVVKKARKTFTPKTFTVTEPQVAYSIKLDKESSASDSAAKIAESELESSELATENTSSSLNNDSNSEVSNSETTYQSISYDMLARNPEKYEFEPLKIQGQVMQVQRLKNETTVLLWMNNNPNSLVMVDINKETLPDNGRILENDELIIDSLGDGTQKYETTLGAENEVPLLKANEKVIDNGQINN